MYADNTKIRDGSHINFSMQYVIMMLSGEGEVGAGGYH